MKKRKLCLRCKRRRLLNKFYSDISKKCGRSSWCKECTKASTLLWRKCNRGKHRKQEAKRRKKNMLAWKPVITSLYPQGPICQICGKKKKWPWKNHGPAIETICFDHKRLSLPIKDTPCRWLGTKEAVPTNIIIFKSCKFGLLCRQCNLRIPTKDRLKWAKRLLKYCK